MILLLVILFLICLWGIKFSDYHLDYIGQEVTTSIKGIFAVIILLSHMRGYIHLTSPTELLYNNIINFIGQLMVAMYFFYSGYGILESCKVKPHYKDTFLRKRIVKTLVHFDLAVFIFLVAETSMLHIYPTKSYILCWIGLESIGNSNWFIFDIIVLYTITYIAMQIKMAQDKRFLWLCILVTIATAFLWFCLVLCQKGSWWYNTLFCFPAGIAFSVFKNCIEKQLKNHSQKYGLTVLFLVFIFTCCRIFPNIISNSLETVIFCLLLTIVSMKVRINNVLLHWLGINAFSIYILQRLPMNIFAELGLNQNNILFTSLTIPSVILLSWRFTKATNIIDSKLFR